MSKVTAYLIDPYLKTVSEIELHDNDDDNDVDEIKGILNCRAYEGYMLFSGDCVLCGVIDDDVTDFASEPIFTMPTYGSPFPGLAIVTGPDTEDGFTGPPKATLEWYRSNVTFSTPAEYLKGERP